MESFGGLRVSEKRKKKKIIGKKALF